MTDIIRKTIIIDAPPEVVFRAITDEKELINWFPDQAKLEARVGGAMEFKFQRDEETVDHTVIGKVLEIIPDKKLSLSWKNTSDQNFPNTTVTWTLELVENGRTRVTLEHSGFEKGRWRDLHDQGWTYFLVQLADYCKK